jgi:hypothetical protein
MGSNAGKSRALIAFALYAVNTYRAFRDTGMPGAGGTMADLGTKVHPGKRMSPRRGKWMAPATGWVALMLAGVAPRAHTAGVSYSNIADTTTTAPGHGAFTSFGFAPPSVSGGNVAFSGTYSGGSGVYTGRVGATGAVKVVDTGDIAPGGGNFNSLASYGPSISGSNLAFLGSGGIYTGSVGATGAVKVVEPGEAAPGSERFIELFAPSISGSNLVFGARFFQAWFNTGVYTARVGATGAAKVVEVGDTAPGHGAFWAVASPSISGSNLAFSGGYGGDRDGSGVYTGSVGATGVVKVVETGDTAPGQGPFTEFRSPSIRGSNLAFIGGYSGGVGIYIGSVGATGVAKVVETGDTAPGHGVFEGLYHSGGGDADELSLSGGNVAFRGTDSDGIGIYLASGGAGGRLSAVLHTGDALFGSTVTSLELGGYDNDAIGFQYTLVDGRSGIGVAIVPEPATGAGLLALAALPLIRRRSRRTKKCGR